MGDLEVAALGGTWGRATSALSQPHEPEAVAVAPLLCEHLPRLRAAHPLMANYAVRYFNDLWRHVQAVSQVMAPRPGPISRTTSRDDSPTARTTFSAQGRSRKCCP